MRFLRKSLILIHRYLGIVFSLLFLMWFVSGIAMIYARSMPALTNESRLEHLPVLNPSQIRLTPAEALAKSGAFAPPAQATLSTVVNRPAYRFGGGFTLFADTGEPFEMNAARAAEAARLFADVREDKVHPVGILATADQWTLLERRSLPMHKFTVDDGAKTELYVSESTGEVAVVTTRASRSLAWIAAIPHWMYFEALRTRPQAWRKVVLWTSGLATISALIGLILGIIQYRKKRPHIPYAGLLRWHYITGVIFGIFTLTWVFSGFLSMEPWFWASDGGLGEGVGHSLQGGQLDLTKFPVAVPSISNVKEVEYLTIQGAPYYRLQTTEPKPILVSATSLQVRSDLFSTESLLSRIMAVNPEAKVLETTLLEDYDSYYYSFGRKAPLPVLRIKFDDPDSTWLYVDPKMSALVGRAHRRERLQRWIYHGFHSLDFSFWYYSRPLWDIVMVGLSGGGILLSSIGVVIAWKRVSRAVARRLH
jgi:PepSY-associated TM region